MSQSIRTSETALFIRTSLRQGIVRPESILEMNLEFIQEEAGWTGNAWNSRWQPAAHRPSSKPGRRSST